MNTRDVALICLQETFTKHDLRAILDEIKKEKSLDPLYAACYVSNRPLTDTEIKHGQELWAEIQKTNQK